MSRLTRRAFTSRSAHLAAGLSLISVYGCAREGAESTFGPKARTTGATRWRALIEFLEREIPERLAAVGTTPGAAMALIDNARLVWSRGFGEKERTSRAPVDSETVFEFGSISKTVFAYVVMKACEKGLLGLDVPLTKYAPERFLAGDPRLDLITARHVLSHRTGFPNWRSKNDPLRIQFTPGTGWNYSGEGYYYLQTVLTHLAGHVDPNACTVFDDGLRVCATDFDAFMKANLLMPFTMSSSGYLYRAGMAKPHDEHGRFIEGREGTAITAARYGSAGQLHSTVEDYAKFLIEIIEPRPADAFRLTPSSRAELLTPQVKLTDILFWGLGWVIERHPGMGDIISHSGDKPGFKAMTAASLSRRSAFVIVTNGDRGFEDVIIPVLRSAPMREFLPVAV